MAYINKLAFKGPTAKKMVKEYSDLLDELGAEVLSFSPDRCEVIFKYSATILGLPGMEMGKIRAKMIADYALHKGEPNFHISWQIGREQPGMEGYDVDFEDVECEVLSPEREKDVEDACKDAGKDGDV